MKNYILVSIEQISIEMCNSIFNNPNYKEVLQNIFHFTALSL